MSSLGKQSHYSHEAKILLNGRAAQRSSRSIKDESSSTKLFWYPGLDKDIEDCAQRCVSCQAVKNAPPVVPLHLWLWPAHPWQRIHVDFAGLFTGKTYLLVVNVHSNGLR